MAAYDPSAKPLDTLQELWKLILSTNPYLKRSQTPAFMDLNMAEAISDDWEKATHGWKPERYGPRTLLVIKDKANKELCMHYVPAVLRIPYAYINAKGEREIEYLLIGFAGGAGE
jgi:hypothetical protein